MPNQPVALAAVSGAHGVAGEVRLKLFGEGVDALLQFASFNEGALTLVKIRADGKGGALARFAEISDRAGAEKLRGTILSVAREEMPQLEPGEYYHADLVGLKVMTDTGASIGKVIAVHNFGASDIIEISKEPAPARGNKSFMVPVNGQAVLDWDRQTLVISASFVDE